MYKQRERSKSNHKELHKHQFLANKHEMFARLGLEKESLHAEKRNIEFEVGEKLRKDERDMSSKNKIDLVIMLGKIEIVIINKLL